ncbi:hypothetical protein CYMTET_40714 [Cymbomonas tetramitiformis]|uniref:YbaK/aminoacyl-tRNA synthetase-associated domain-containing protein n=1 Tax=Cymbomonas tetramitiformis TaxID=36881 RepID=A0AAE0C9Q0_9CHLO|nr:hypothetical protein CYMTET_40714 [Cymbomonas tetramitiformis]
MQSVSYNVETAGESGSEPCLTADDLQKFLTANNIPSKIEQMPHEAASVEESAQALGICADRLVKSIVLWISEEYPIMVVAAGTRRINLSAVAKLLSVSRKKCRMCKPEEALLATGYRIGTIPPIGHRTVLRTLVDKSVMSAVEESAEDGLVYCGGGDLISQLVISPSELLKAANGEVVDILS